MLIADSLWSGVGDQVYKQAEKALHRCGPFLAVFVTPGNILEFRVTFWDQKVPPGCHGSFCFSVADVCVQQRLLDHSQPNGLACKSFYG